MAYSVPNNKANNFLILMARWWIKHTSQKKPLFTGFDKVKYHIKFIQLLQLHLENATLFLLRYGEKSYVATPLVVNGKKNGYTGNSWNGGAKRDMEMQAFTSHDETGSGSG